MPTLIETATERLSSGIRRFRLRYALDPQGTRDLDDLIVSARHLELLENQREINRFARDDMNGPELQGFKRVHSFPQSIEYRKV